jgi:hypothetical protein
MYFSNWKQVHGTPNRSDVSIPFRRVETPFATYEKIIQGGISPVAFVDPGVGSMLYYVDQVGVVYRYDTTEASRSNEVRIEPNRGTVYLRGGDRIVHPPLLDISSKLPEMEPVGDERGLLQMIFHPTEKNVFYLYYTVPPPEGATYANRVILEEWVMDEPGWNPEPVRVLIDEPHPENNHFGSPIGFGPKDGLLYLGTGDGGGAGDQHGPIGNAQNPDSFWGKIWTIDVERDPPVVTLSSIGYRNPWRASFSVSGYPLLGDVGQDQWEGVHLDKGGENHGWRAIENGHVYDRPLYEELIDRGERITCPLMWYGHTLGRSVIGGYQINRRGDYVFGDYTGNEGIDNIYLIRGGTLLLQDSVDQRNRFLHSFGQDRYGQIYAIVTESLGMSGNTGQVWKIQFR